MIGAVLIVVAIAIAVKVIKSQSGGSSNGSTKYVEKWNTGGRKGGR